MKTKHFLSLFIAILLVSCENLFSPENENSTAKNEEPTNMLIIKINDKIYQPDSMFLSYFETKENSKVLKMHKAIFHCKDINTMVYAVFFDSTYLNIYIENKDTKEVLYDMVLRTSEIASAYYQFIDSVVSGKFRGTYISENNDTAKIEAEFINMQYYIPYYAHEFVLDTSKVYDLAGKWYYVGTSKKGELKNFYNPVPATFPKNAEIWFDPNELPDYYQINKYKYFTSILNQAFGNYEIRNDSIKAVFQTTPHAGLPWERKWRYFQDSIFRQENNFQMEKEHNILRVFFDNKQQALVYYAKPEERN